METGPGTHVVAQLNDIGHGGRRRKYALKEELALFSGYSNEGPPMFGTFSASTRV